VNPSLLIVEQAAQALRIGRYKSVQIGRRRLGKELEDYIEQRCAAEAVGHASR